MYTPVSPTTSGSAATRVTTGMHPADMASATARPNPSCRLAWTYTEARANRRKSWSSGTKPRNSTLAPAARRNSSILSSYPLADVNEARIGQVGRRLDEGQ